MATPMRRAVCIVLLLGCGGCVTPQQPHTLGPDYAGSIYWTCGSTDGPATFGLLKARSSAHDFLRLYVSGFGPSALHGIVQASNDSYLSNVDINLCTSDDESLCTIETNPTTSGRVTISSNRNDNVEGVLRFKKRDGSWGEVSFKAKIVPPPHRMICG
jgi:hypothetical protein